MKHHNVVFATAILLAGCWAADQDILTILNQQSGVSTFISLLEQFPNVTNILNQGTFSVLVPNDLAFAVFTNQNPNWNSDPDDVQALLQYHVANGTHPSASFGLQPLFVPTMLTSPNYTNVTGGQVVELTSVNNQASVISGIRATAHVLEADILYLGGLIQIVDSVLTIPISFPATVTKAGLTDLVALLNKGGFLTPSSPAVTIVNSLSDLTVFAPNSTQYSASYDGWNGLSSTDLLSVLEYSISEGPVIYSSDFKNNSKIPTLERISMTMTEQNGKFFVDTSLITSRDYLTSNGVLQILDSPLNPNTTGKSPQMTPVSNPGTGGGGLSAPGAAGVGIAIGAVVLGGALITALCIRNRRQRKFTQLSRGYSRDPPPRYELDTKAVRDGVAELGEAPTTTHQFEIFPAPMPPSPAEIDGREKRKSRISVRIHGTPPRHLGFQARF